MVNPKSSDHKAGLICPTCGEGLATFANDIDVVATIKCRQCESSFHYAWTGMDVPDGIIQNPTIIQIDGENVPDPQ